MSEPMKISVEIEVQEIADEIIRKLTEDETLVEVVRCKDCKEWDEENHWCNIRDSYGWDYKPDDYCSYGVRKVGEDAAD